MPALPLWFDRQNPEPHSAIPLAGRLHLVCQVGSGTHWPKAGAPLHQKLGVDLGFAVQEPEKRTNLLQKGIHSDWE